MKSKSNPFRSSAISGAAVVFACFTLLKPCAQADALFIGSAGDHYLTTGTNWVGGTAAGDWNRLQFGSDVVDGNLDLNNFNGRSGITLTSGVTKDITILNDQPLIMGAVLSDGGIDMSAAAHNLTIDTPYWMWDNADWNIASGQTLTIHGGIGQNLPHNITLHGGGTVTLSSPAGVGATSITGTTTINGGVLSAIRDNLGSGSIVINSGGELYVNDQWVLQGVNPWVNSYGVVTNVTVNTGGQLVFDAVNGYANGIPNLYLNGGSVSGGAAQGGLSGLYLYNGNEQITAGGATTSTISSVLSLAGNNNIINVGSGSLLTLAGTLQNGSWGVGGFIKADTGTLNLTGALNFTGGITVNGGTVQMPSGSWNLNAIAHYPITVNSGATLELPADPSAYAVGPTLNGGTISSSGVNNSGWPNITLEANRQITAGGSAVSTISTWLGFCGNGTFSVGSGSTLNITGRLTGDWIESRTGVFKTDAGTLTLSSAANDYDCDTTISGGTLAFGGAGQLNGGNYGYNIINNAALVYGSSAAQTLSGKISGTTGTVTQNAGTLTLSGANTYGGATTVNGGTLVIGNAEAVVGTSGITVNGAYGSGGHLRFDSGTDGGTISTPISVVGGDYDWNMSVTVPNNLMFTGPINLSGGALIVAEGGNSTLNFNNAFHGTDGLTFAALSGGKNFMVLSGPSDFSGDFSLINWNGSPQVTLSGGDNRLPSTAVVRLAGSTGSPSALDLNGNNQTIAGLGEPGWGGADAGARHVVNTSGTAVTLTLHTTADQSSGVIIGGTDINGTAGNNLSLVKTGNGTQTLTGVNTFSGNTTVNGGTLSLGHVNSNNESSTVSIAAGAGAKLDLAFTGTDTVGLLYINGVQQPAGDYTSVHPSGAFTGGGTLHVTSGPSFNTWANGTFANGALTDKTPAGDPDHDGVNNLMEYAIAGLDPTVPNGAIGTFIDNTLTFTKRQPPAPDLTYVIEISPNIQTGTWTPQVTQAPGNTETTISFPLLGGPGKLFARLRVELQP